MTITIVRGITATNTGGSGGGVTVGAAISGGTPNEVLYGDSSGNVAQSLNLTFDGSTLGVGISNTVLLAAAAQIFSLTGVGGSNNENLSIDLDSATANQIDLSSTTGVTGVNFGSMAVMSNGTQIGYPKTVYASGTVYSLTNTQAAIDFGTTDPGLTLDKAGTWLILSSAQLKYNAATYAGNQTATLKLRRTNNTAADLTSATRTVDLRIITTITDNAGLVQIPAVIYTTANINDAIAMFGAVSAAPAAGSVDVTSAEILAVRLYG